VLDKDGPRLQRSRFWLSLVAAAFRPAPRADPLPPPYSHN